MVSFPQASPPTPRAQLSPPPYTPHTQPISFFLILPPAQFWVRSTEFLNITTYKYSSMLVFIYHFYILSLLLESLCLNRGFEAADFQYTFLTKHQKGYNTYQELSTQLMTT
jgi:hypothetical protein